MSSKPGPRGPDTPFRGTTGGIGAIREDSAGCIYHTPDGECGDPGATHQIDGTDVTLCPEHLEAVLEENGLARSEVGA